MIRLYHFQKAFSELFLIVAVEDRPNQNMNIGMKSLFRNPMLVRLVKEKLTLVTLGVVRVQSASKNVLVKIRVRPKLFEVFLAPIMYQDLFSNISKNISSGFWYAGEEVLIHYRSQKSSKNFGRTQILTKTSFGAFRALMTPRVTEVNFFYQTDKHEVSNQWPPSNIHILIKSVFHSNNKKSSKNV